MEIALVYMVAGISSRFGGKIKQFAKVTDEDTLIEYSLKQAIPAGFTKIIFVVGNKTEQPFKEKFGDNYKGIPIEYCLQNFNPQERDKPWGTTDALCAAKNSLNSAFVVCNGDDLYGENTFKILVDHLKNNQEEATIGYRLKNVLPEQGTVKRGIFKVRDDFVTSIEEIFDINRDNLKEKMLSDDTLCSMNILAFHPHILIELDRALKEFKQINARDKKKECLLPTELNKIINSGYAKIKVYPAEDQWFGVTNPEDELEVKKQLEKCIK